MHQIKSDFLNKIAKGLKRKSIDKASTWAENYRVMDNKGLSNQWSFRCHPWLKEMHDSKAEINIGQKAAQMGYTEAILNVVFYKMDIERVDCLYVLPSKTPDASDFSSSRFDPALELSSHLSSMFSDVRNVGHKRAGTSNLYIRGANSKSGLRSIPVGFIAVDEVDVMNEENIPLLMERVSGQLEWNIWMISTPTIENFGINHYFNATTKEHFFFKCPSCSRLTELTFPDSIEIIGDSEVDTRVKESFYKCKECKNKLPHETKNEWLGSASWVPQYTDRDQRGFHINQMYSFMDAGKPEKIAKAHFRALSNPSAEQELYNSKLGKTHETKGAKILASEIDDCIGSFKNGELRGKGLVTMGVDVGKWLHFEIVQWYLDPKMLLMDDFDVYSKAKVIEFGKVRDFEEFDIRINRHKINFIVVDANPETRMATIFAQKYFGFVKLCYYYSRGGNGKNISVNKEREFITVDRTVWMDQALGRFKEHNKSITLPIDTDNEYKTSIQNPTRIYRTDSSGNSNAVYVCPEHHPDHYAHARTYSEIALKFAGAAHTNKDIGKVL